MIRIKWKGEFTSIIWMILFIIIASIIIILFFWGMGFFDFKETEPTATVVAASITFVGTLITAVISIIGIFLNHSIEKRNADLKAQEVRRLEIESQRNIELKEKAEKRLEIESQRNIELKAEAEERLKIESQRNIDLKEDEQKRLKIEAATKAIEQLSFNIDDETIKAQRAAILFALSDLEMHDLALTMLRDILESQHINMATAVDIMNLAFISGNEYAKEEASDLLFTYSLQLYKKDGDIYWPRHVALKMDQNFNFYTRQNIILASLQAMLGQPLKKWDRPRFNVFIVFLLDILENEQEESIKDVVRFCLKKIIDIYPPGRILHTHKGELEIDELREELSKYQFDKDKLTTMYNVIANYLDNWNLEDSPVDKSSQIDKSTLD